MTLGEGDTVADLYRAVAERARAETLARIAVALPHFAVVEDPHAGQCPSCGACIGYEESHDERCADIAREAVEAVRKALGPPLPTEPMSDFDRENVTALLAMEDTRSWWSQGDPAHPTTWFSARLLRLIAQADPAHRARLALGFPQEVEAFLEWREPK